LYSKAIRYGPPPHPLPRAVIGRGRSKNVVIELHPLRLKVFRLVRASSEGANTPHPWITISSGVTVTTLCSALSKCVAVTAHDVPYRIWKIGVALNDSQEIEYLASQLPLSDAKILDASDKTLEEEGLELDDAFVVEFKQPDGWIAEAPRSLLQPAPVFNSDEGFFNKMTTTLPVSSTAFKSSYFDAPGTSVSKPSVALTLSNKTFMKTLEPGTLGLGNMSVISQSCRVDVLIFIQG
jgi:ubiquitin carboxyl-terminal hydrolase 4/11/15